MAMVLRARDEALGRTVALKILPPALAGDPDFRQRFLREARAVAAVDHPHIIPVYAAGEANGVLYLAMRYITGGDLRTVAQREGPLPGPRAVALLSPVASALDAAHRAGLIHRDVKPANILVDTGADGLEHPYLSDFGLAKGSASSTGLTGTGQYLGTPDYSAPEQISGKRTGPGTDQYALACVAYTILTGRLPFPRDESMAVLWAHVYDRPPQVTGQRPDLPAAVDRVVARALAKDPAERFGTCGEFMTALSTVLTESAGTERRDEFATRRPPVSVGDTWPRQPESRQPNWSAQAPPPGRRLAKTPPPSFLSGPALGETQPRGPVEPISVPPVTAPAGSRTAAGRARRPRAGRSSRRPVIVAAVALAVLAAGGGGYALWQSVSGQDQYYVGISAGGYVAIFRGSSVQTRSTLRASMLAGATEAALEQRISADSLADAEQRIDQLQSVATNCQDAYQQLAAWQTKELSYQRYLQTRALAATAKTKPPTAVANPGARPAQLPSAAQCAPSTAYGIPASALPSSGTATSAATAPATPASTPSQTAAAAGSQTAAPQTFTGTGVETIYGPVQVQLTVAHSKITTVKELQPSSDSIGSDAISQLNQEALTAQSASIDAVSGATYTSAGYIQSLQSALDKAGR
jgi:serine/threonine-protein kinase